MSRLERAIEIAVRGAAAEPLARRAKLADKADDSDLSRLPQPSARDLERLEQHRRGRTILERAGEI